MSIFAEVKDGSVVELWDFPSGFPPNNSVLTFVAADEGVERGDKWDGTSFSKVDPVPEVITKLGLKYAMGAQWPTVRDAIMASPDLKEDWDLTTALHRNSPLVTGTAAAFGFTPEQMDDIFRAAAGVSV